MNKIRIAKDRGTKPAGIMTRLHVYSYDMSKPGDVKAWDALKAERAAAGVPCFEVIPMGGDGKPVGQSRTVTLETENLFGNQWNSAPDDTSANGWRLFNWFLEAHYSNGRNCKTMKRGHWLEITPAMREILSETHKCGYCGAEYYGKTNAGAFCGACLDSPYLKEDELYMLRLEPVSMSEHFTKRAGLTDNERAELLPLYVERQTKGKDSRAAVKRASQRAEVIAKCNEKTNGAKTERDGFLWLMDHGLDIDNVIFYSHTGRFGFGWRQPVGAAVKSRLLDVLCEFPFDYDIK